MQQITNLPSQSSLSTGLRTLSQTANEIFASLEPEVQAELASYPSNGKEDAYPTLESACADFDAPSLARLDSDFGQGTSIIWLSVQLLHVASYTGICEKLHWNQIEDTAKHLRNVSAEFGITLPEMMQFFSRFEQGFYQQFIGYERPNPQVIMKSFQRFVGEEIIPVRVRVQQAKEAKEEREMMAEARRNAVPCPPEIEKRLSKLYSKFNVNASKIQETESSGGNPDESPSV